MKLMKELKWTSMVTSILFIILGIVLIVMPNTSAYMIVNIVGAIMLFAGFSNIARYFMYPVDQVFGRYNFMSGILLIALGIIFIIKNDIFVAILPVVLGIVVIVSGVFKLQSAIDAKRMGYNSNVYIVLAILSIIAGFVIVFNPFTTIKLLFIFMGIGLIYSGISDIITTFYISYQFKDLIR